MKKFILIALIALGLAGCRSGVKNGGSNDVDSLNVERSVDSTCTGTCSGSALVVTKDTLGNL